MNATRTFAEAPPPHSRWQRYQHFLDKHLPASSLEGQKTITGLRLFGGILLIGIAVVGRISIASELASGYWLNSVSLFPVATGGLLVALMVLSGMALGGTVFFYSLGYGTLACVLFAIL